MVPLHVGPFTTLDNSVGEGVGKLLYPSEHQKLLRGSWNLFMTTKGNATQKSNRFSGSNMEFLALDPLQKRNKDGIYGCYSGREVFNRVADSRTLHGVERIFC